jgi:hypothetical protein
MDQRLPNCSPLAIAEVAALLCPVTGKTPREINTALPFTARSMVREALLVLVRTGRASFDGEMGKRRYRLTPTQTEATS